MSPYTADQLEQIFHAALKAGDIKGVDAALLVMATIDPLHAQRLLKSLQVSVALAGDQ
ncbi:MAG: hypothetical protein ACOH1Y_09860 [Propionicimonas sp.]